MSNRHTQSKVQQRSVVNKPANNKQTEVLLTQTHTQTDSPLLPVEQMSQLHQFRPDLVDFVIEQTKLEAEHRRKETSAINNKIYLERVLSIVASMIICSLGIIGGGYIALHGQAWAGTTIASVSIGTLAVSYLRKSTKNAS